jgi:hypothetical protein
MVRGTMANSLPLCFLNWIPAYAGMTEPLNLLTLQSNSLQPNSLNFSTDFNGICY